MLPWRPSDLAHWNMKTSWSRSSDCKRLFFCSQERNTMGDIVGNHRVLIKDCEVGARQQQRRKAHALLLTFSFCVITQSKCINHMRVIWGKSGDPWPLLSLISFRLRAFTALLPGSNNRKHTKKINFSRCSWNVYAPKEWLEWREIKSQMKRRAELLFALISVRHSRAPQGESSSF